jgi:hypothetical protein
MCRSTNVHGRSHRPHGAHADAAAWPRRGAPRPLGTVGLPSSCIIKVLTFDVQITRRPGSSKSSLSFLSDHTAGRSRVLPNPAQGAVGLPAERGHGAGCVPVPVYVRVCACVCACVYLCMCVCVLVHGFASLSTQLQGHASPRRLGPRHPNAPRHPLLAMNVPVCLLQSVCVCVQAARCC